jgi:predicted ATPase
MRGELERIRIQNFKAVANSDQLPLTALTAFIGNNGSGKSSVIEALQTLQRLITDGLDAAMQVFKGMEHVKHKSAARTRQRLTQTGEPVGVSPLWIELRGSVQVGGDGPRWRKTFTSQTALLDRKRFNEYFVQRDEVTLGRQRIHFPAALIEDRVADQAERLSRSIGPFIRRWQFLSLDPSRMGDPSPTRRAYSSFLLDPNGGNLADYLWHLVKDHGKEGTQAWDGIVEALRFVLPYAERVESAQTIELERRSYVHLAERGFEIPGWMLSTGTMRVLALLAVFRHPDPPPLICIEEIENGLDPRTLRLVVNEIQSLVESKRSQVILTTHSPYLLDMLPLSSVLMTQRTPKGVTFTRPADNKAVKKWAGDFAPGQLYMMGRFDAEVAP